MLLFELDMIEKGCSHPAMELRQCLELQAAFWIRRLLLDKWGPLHGHCEILHQMHFNQATKMLAPPHSPQRYPPPPLSPSRSLIGLEKVIPPQARSPGRSSPFLPVGDGNQQVPARTRSSSRSPFSPTVNRDKPLPERPGRSSSVYSADRGHTGIVDSCSDHSQDEAPPVPLTIQPTDYPETISALLRRRLDDPPSPTSVPSRMSITTQASHAYSHSHQVSPESPARSAVSAPSVADSRNAPSFKEFSRNLQNKRVQAIEADSPPLPSPHTSIHFRAVSYESTRRARSVSPKTTDTVDPSLVPAPLSIHKCRDDLTEGGSNTDSKSTPEEEERSASRFSKTSSDDSYVIYTGLRESVRAYVRHKMRKKRGNSNKERERVMSVASAKYPGMLTAKGYDRKHSSGSQRVSVQQGIASAYGKISKLSTSTSSGQSTESGKQPRGRQKQLAIPTSAYQKYGVAVWERPKRPKKTKRASTAPMTLVKKDNDGRVKRKPSMSTNSAEVVGAFQSGRSRIIHALDDTKLKMKRSHSEKKREALKQSIRLVGQADQVSDGTKTYPI